ncbi:hypothetical protein [Pacificoceanicola onchidii]|uniref:hypothetical protein n=1 Tax=Pacificoceanicola onchidii TaxID=2562685 RepID=UPI0010A660CA|nr:hypothetical protein [Pacificoceanicola onchidii]
MLKKTRALLSLLVPQSWLSTAYITERLSILMDDPATCEHDWYVVAGILDTVELQVQCMKCGTYSEVPEPTQEEWNACAGAMENPYPWEDTSRIRYYQTDEAAH